MTENAANLWHRLPRWTLRGWFAFVAFSALLVSHVYVANRVRVVEQENFFLKYRFGFPRHDNPNLIQSAAVPMPHPAQWRYRILVPKGRQLDLKVAYSNIPTRGLPLIYESERVPYRNDETHENILDAYILFEDGKAYLWCAFDESMRYRQEGRMPVALPKDHFLQQSLPRTRVNNWAAPTILDGPIEKGEGGSTVYGWDSIQEKPGEPLILLRWRSDRSTRNDCDGLMIWLEDRAKGK